MAVFATRTSFAGHASLGAKAAHELRFALDHPVGADQYLIPAVVVISFIAAASIAWVIAPRMRARNQRNR